MQHQLSDCINCKGIGVDIVCSIGTALLETAVSDPTVQKIFHALNTLEASEVDCLYVETARNSFLGYHSRHPLWWGQEPLEVWGLGPMAPAMAMADGLEPLFKTIDHSSTLPDGFEDQIQCLLKPSEPLRVILRVRMTTVP
jgi:hypothetical protein